MCLYCNPDKSMDILDMQMLYDTIDMGFLGNLSVMSRINPEDSEMELTILNDQGRDQVFKTKIAFCPFCGRKLSF